MQKLQEKNIEERNILLANELFLCGGQLVFHYNPCEFFGQYFCLSNLICQRFLKSEAALLSLLSQDIPMVELGESKGRRRMENFSACTTLEINQDCSS